MPGLEPRGKNDGPPPTRAPGLVLLDEKRKPIFYNAEAERILNYQRNNRNPQNGEGVEAAVHSMILERKGTKRATASPGEILTGKKRYSWRTFPVFAKSGKKRVTALLIEANRAPDLDVASVAREFRLSEREEETVLHLTLGLTSKEIAARMEVSPNTVKAFLRNIMNKMSVSTRSGILGKLLKR